eukprot:CAMPEP_0170528510 /NCGR_PEP_ID=MMETSP0209-20121228/14019_1 /TAXON_ID=665100 ORGANISM="Litonotus pictus, Strain P1" /NCGR_SAMPLE_ID=MMETSP0209 /ASSEMBLY_ACC=CAM_ASM_000301 /LENGTH=57 /DNA_ID=CAMNT_0010819773 /DNA_START=132 /DNA_END=301 /DNA_ORIENTATION=+
MDDVNLLTISVEDLSVWDYSYRLLSLKDSFPILKMSNKSSVKIFMFGGKETEVSVEV